MPRRSYFKGEHWQGWMLFLAALLLRLLAMAAWYSADLSHFQSGDYILYTLGAQHFRDHLDFSNSLFLVRPPVFPLLVYLLGNQGLVVIMANIAIGALIAPVTYALGKRLQLSAPVALVAGLIVAFDPGSIAYSTFLGPEPLANLFLALILVTLLAALQSPLRLHSVLLSGLAGVWLALSALTRPAVYLLWSVLGLWALLAYRARRLATVVFMVISAAGVGGWMLHNYVVFGHATFSTVGIYTMVYYRAASIEHLASGRDIEEVYTAFNQRIETLLGHDPSLADAGYRHRYLAATPEVSQALSRVALETMVHYPLYTILTLPLGFARMYGLTEAVLFRAQPLGALAEIGWNLLFLSGTVYGLWDAFRRREWTFFWPVLLCLLYFTAGVLLVKTAGLDVRERSILVPLMAVSSARALHVLWLRWHAR